MSDEIIQYQFFLSGNQKLISNIPSRFKKVTKTKLAKYRILKKNVRYASNSLMYSLMTNKDH